MQKRCRLLFWDVATRSLSQLFSWNYVKCLRTATFQNFSGRLHKSPSEISSIAFSFVFLTSWLNFFQKVWFHHNLASCFLKSFDRELSDNTSSIKYGKYSFCALLVTVLSLLFTLQFYYKSADKPSALLTP